MDLVSRLLQIILNYNNKKILDKDNSYLKFLVLKVFLKKWPYEESDEEKENVQIISEKNFEDLKKRLKDPPFHKDKWKPININGEVLPPSFFHNIKTEDGGVVRPVGLQRGHRPAEGEGDCFGLPEEP